MLAVLVDSRGDQAYNKWTVGAAYSLECADARKGGPFMDSPPNITGLRTRR